MIKILGINSFGLSKTWQTSENFLTSPPLWQQSTLKIIGCITVILSIIALAMISLYRSRYTWKTVDQNADDPTSKMVKDSKVTRLFLVRHGETDWNAQHLLQGSSDIPLNSKGLEQATETAKSIEKTDISLKAIYSSDLSRAYCTAEKTAQRLGLSITMEPAFREISLGEGEGISIDERDRRYEKIEQELNAKYPEPMERWKYASIPGAETDYQVAQRVINAMVQIANKHEGENVGIFTHGKVIKVLSKFFAEKNNPPPRRIGNGSITEFHATGDVQKPFKFIKLTNLDIGLISPKI